LGLLTDEIDPGVMIKQNGQWVRKDVRARPAGDFEVLFPFNKSVEDASLRLVNMITPPQYIKPEVDSMDEEPEEESEPEPETTDDDDDDDAGEKKKKEPKKKPFPREKFDQRHLVFDCKNSEVLRRFCHIVVDDLSKTDSFPDPPESPDNDDAPPPPSM